MKFLIEWWNPVIRRYAPLGEYNNYERALIMMNKPYVKTMTRRLKVVDERTITIARAETYVNDDITKSIRTISPISFDTVL